MPHLSAERLYFIARARGHEHQRDAAPIQFGQCLLGFGKEAGAMVQQGVFKSREN